MLTTCGEAWEGAYQVESLTLSAMAQWCGGRAGTHEACPHVEARCWRHWAGAPPSCRVQSGLTRRGGRLKPVGRGSRLAPPPGTETST